jgi:excisionase family DNA binding protein
MTEPEHYQTIEEIADRLQVSDQTIRRWIKSGSLPAYKPGREWRIRTEDLEKFLEARSSPKAPAPSSLEPTLWNGRLDEGERRLQYLRPWRAFVHGLARRWEKEPPKTSREIAPLYEALTAVVEQGVFGPAERVNTAEAHELMLLTLGFERLNEIANKVEQDDERNAVVRDIREKFSA